MSGFREHRIGTASRWLAAAVCLAAASYAAYVATAWLRYGKVTRPDSDDQDVLLDQFMPAYDVAERHHVRIGAPAAVTFQAASDMYLERSTIVRAIFKAREWIMRSHAVREPEARAFLDQMRAIGWGVLAEIPGREIVMGAVTRPWTADVVFRPLPPDQFAAFAEPDYVKIAWTLRADPIGAAASIFRTETRVVTTDRTARAKFRRYWAFASPGIILIRWASLGPLKGEAERRSVPFAHTMPSRRVSDDGAEQPADRRRDRHGQRTPERDAAGAHRCRRTAGARGQRAEGGKRQE
jgi:hypothetical protein